MPLTRRQTLQAAFAAAFAPLISARPQDPATMPAPPPSTERSATPQTAVTREDELRLLAFYRTSSDFWRRALQEMASDLTARGEHTNNPPMERAVFHWQIFDLGQPPAAEQYRRALTSGKRSRK